MQGFQPSTNTTKINMAYKKIKDMTYKKIKYCGGKLVTKKLLQRFIKLTLYRLKTEFLY